MSNSKISTFINVALNLPKDVSILLRGDHGIGKSQVVRQIAALYADKHDIKNFPIVDRRLSQMTEGDMVGLPSTDGEVTRFNPPDWYKSACTNPVCLFLDELNRATPEVMQAAFQIVLDRELNGHQLHPETRVFAAVNSGASYNVNEIDPALLDRFFVVDLRPELEDFEAWAIKENTSKPFGVNCAPIVLDFLKVNEKFLDPAKNCEMDHVQPSRRSWERVGDALACAQILEKPENPLFYQICVGFVGLEASMAFHSFVKEFGQQISGDDILNNFSKVKARFVKLTAERQVGVTTKTSEEILKLEKLSPKQQKNIKAFFKELSAEHKISFWTSCVKMGAQNIELARTFHAAVGKSLVEDVFGVPAGKAGINKMPNIPGFLKSGE